MHRTLIYPFRSTQQGHAMKTTHTTLLSLLVWATAASLSPSAQAQSLSKTDYKAEKDKISATYRTDRAACNSEKGHAKDICIAQARGKEDVDKASLEERYKPSEKNRYKAQMAKADADYAVAKARCNEQTGSARETCDKDAKVAHTNAKAEAKAQKK